MKSDTTLLVEFNIFIDEQRCEKTILFYENLQAKLSINVVPPIIRALICNVEGDLKIFLGKHELPNRYSTMEYIFKESREDARGRGQIEKFPFLVLLNISVCQMYT